MIGKASLPRLEGGVVYAMVECLLLAGVYSHMPEIYSATHIKLNASTLPASSVMGTGGAGEKICVT